jgi:hypothetical protein
MKKIITLFSILFLIVKFSFGQTMPFQSKDDFTKDLNEVFAKSKNTNYVLLGNKFITNYWQSSKLTEGIKGKILNITAAAYSKPNGTAIIYNCLNGLVTAIDLCYTSQIESYADAMYKTISQQEMSVLNSFLVKSNLFMTTKMFFRTFSTNVYINEKTFDFGYAGYVDTTVKVQPPTENAPLPTTIESLTKEKPMNMGDGPFISIENATMKLLNRDDTLTLTEVSGLWMLSSGVFFGKTAKHKWMYKHKGNEVNLVFSDFSFNTGVSYLVADNVILYPGDKDNLPIKGIFEFKTSKTSKALKDYPRFSSKTSDISFQSIAANANYYGGFSLFGRFFSSQSADNKPSVFIFDNQKCKYKVSSTKFTFKDSSIVANPASVAIYIGRDSIVHSGVQFQTDVKGNSAKFNRLKGDLKTTWFNDSFHGFEFSADAINWDLNKNILDIDMNAGKNQIPVLFKSKNQFSEKDIFALQGVGGINPLRLLFGYVKKTKATAVYAGEVATEMKVNLNSLNGMLSNLRNKGFIDINPINGEIQFKEKAYHYINSIEGKKDFDNLYIPSLSPDSANATIIVDSSYMMKVRGVDRFYISDSSNVFAIPDSGVIKIYQDESIVFSGKLVAGIFEFKGNDFKFKYDSFLVSMQKIDTIKFINLKKENKAEANAQKSYMDNQLVMSSGTLFINEPNNKSGKKSLPQYPKFNAISGSNVYFDNKAVLGGAYDRRIYFKIPPFKSDSVKKADNSHLKFKGRFFSGGLFPEFDDELAVQKDKSMGFEHQTPPEGFPIFEGKGIFKGSIKLDHNGLVGEGEVRYKSSTFYSKYFIFYQDSLIAKGDKVAFKEFEDSLAYFPQGLALNYAMKWNTKADSVQILNLSTPFEFYNKKVSTEGYVTLKPSGMTGGGLLKMKGEQVISPFIEFTKSHVTARHSILSSKIPNYNKPSIVTNNVKIIFDVNVAQADINPEIKGMPGISFPICEYSTSIEKAHWDLNKRIVTMESESKDDVSSSHFVATNPIYDSLVFNGASATYDMNRKTLKIQGVPYINVADTRILPDSNRVTIYEEGKIQTFKKAKLVMDTLYGYHHLEKATIEISSRTKFDGTAIYKYSNFNGDTLYIPFQNFYLDEEKITKRITARFTTSKSFLDENSKFYIAPKILYRGPVVLHANKKTLLFDGQVKVSVHNKGFLTGWIPYRHDGKENDFYVHFTSELDAKAKKALEAAPVAAEITDSTQIHDPVAFCGFNYNTQTLEIYNTLLSKKKNENDLIIFNAPGILRYNKFEKDLEAGKLERLDGKTLEGNKYVYDDSTGNMICEGKFQLTADHPNFSLLTVGVAREEVAVKHFYINSLMLFKLDMPSKPLELMAKKINEINSEAATLKDSLAEEKIPTMKIKLANLEGNKTAKNYEADYKYAAEYKPLFRYSSTLSQGISFSEVKMVWSHLHKAWHSIGLLKLSNIYNKDINREIEGAIEIKKTETGDVVSVFLRPSKDSYYYFSFTPSRLALISSEEDFNTAIKSKSKGESGNVNVYSYLLADETEKSLFVKDFYKNHFDRDYELENPMQLKNIPVEADTMPLNQEEIQMPTKGKKGKKKKVEEVSTSDTVQATQQEEIMLVPAKDKKKRKKANVEDTPSNELKSDSIGTKTDEEEGMLNPKKENKKKKIKAIETQLNEIKTDSIATKTSEEEGMFTPKKERKKKSKSQETEVEPPIVNEKVDSTQAPTNDDDMFTPKKKKKTSRAKAVESNP